MSDESLAQAFIDAQLEASLMTLPSARPGGLSLDAAYRLARTIERLRIEAGDRPRGWKIGFTNRRIWPRYGVHEPIWGRVWNSSLTLLEGQTAEVSLSGLVQPRIEPEIVFGIARAPHADMDDADLLGCLDWVAHGAEIVHTHYADWKFGGVADTVADQGLHGRLIVGPRVKVWPGLGADLASMSMALLHDGKEVDRGHGALVLDGPLDALRIWLRAMATQSPDWQVAAGEVVTTGTLTDAWPVAAGERWSTLPGDPRLAALDLHFLP